MHDTYCLHASLHYAREPLRPYWSYPWSVLVHAHSLSFHGDRPFPKLPTSLTLRSRPSTINTNSYRSQDKKSFITRCEIMSARAFYIVQLAFIRTSCTLTASTSIAACSREGSLLLLQHDPHINTLCYDKFWINSILINKKHRALRNSGSCKILLLIYLKNII